MNQMPASGRAWEEVYQDLLRYGADDLEARGGDAWAYVYDSGRVDVDRAAREAYTMYLDPNGLDPTVFPSLRWFENDILAVAAAHLGGDDRVVGSFTSGGTESVLLAVLAARNQARRDRGVEHPEMVLPTTAHAAFHKAAALFGVKKVVVGVDPVTFRADVDRMAEAITPNTALLVGSAVSYAHGVIDPIEELGRLARSRDLLLHVDGCIGAFTLPYFRRLGAQTAPFDFNVDGVTSISMDLHKYAYCPKGASVVLYRDESLRRRQMFACAEWTGYTMVNMTLQSSKSGGPLAAAWAVLNLIGDDGYLDIARRTLDAVRTIVEAIDQSDDFRLLGRPDSSLIAFTSETVDVFHLVDEMKIRGWYVQPQLSFDNSPANVHLTVSGVSDRRVDRMLFDLNQSAQAAKRLPPPLDPDQRDWLAGLSPDRLTESVRDRLYALAGLDQGDAAPERFAPVSAMLDALSPAMRELVLEEYFSMIYTPR